MKPTGIPATLLPHELDPDAEQRIAISRLLDRRRALWDKSKPWVNEVLHGSAEVARQLLVENELCDVKRELLALGYTDRFCTND